MNQLWAILSKEDLFQAGDVFTAEAYSEFSPNGLMDDGSTFGYQVDIVRIAQDETDAYNAVIRVTRQK